MCRWNEEKLIEKKRRIARQEQKGNQGIMTAKVRGICKEHGMIIRMVIIVLLALVPLAAGQTETVESGSCGTNVSWVLDDQGVLTISGTGPITSIPWIDNATLKAMVKEAVVEDGVTSLYYGNTFAGCANLTKVTLADSVTDVKTYTFMNCTELTEVTLPSGLTQIGNSLFSGCSALENITIPGGVTQIGNSAFYGCSSLTEMTLPPNLETIGSQAFEDCSGLTEIALPDALTQIGSNAFGRCRSLLSIILPDSTVTIGRDAFLRDWQRLRDVCTGGLRRGHIFQPGGIHIQTGQHCKIQPEIPVHRRNGDAHRAGNIGR